VVAAGNRGFYAIVEASLLARDALDVAGWLRAGVADDRFNDFRQYLGAGVTAAGLVPGRPDDQLGLAIGSAQAGMPWRAAQALAATPADARETTVELTWRMPMNDWLTLQPDLQYVINPGLSPELDDAFVVGLRFELGASWAR
jgi:porin